jgi:hypothetical protein
VGGQDRERPALGRGKDEATSRGHRSSQWLASSLPKLVGIGLQGQHQCWLGLAKEGRSELAAGGPVGLVASCLMHCRHQAPGEGACRLSLSRAEHPGPRGPGVQQMQLPARNRLWGSPSINKGGESQWSRPPWKSPPQPYHCKMEPKYLSRA